MRGYEVADSSVGWLVAPRYESPCGVMRCAHGHTRFLLLPLRIPMRGYEGLQGLKGDTGEQLRIPMRGYEVL